MIRPATAQDLDALVSISRRTFIETYAGMGPRPKGLEEQYGRENFTREKLLPELALYRMAFDEDRPVGFAKLESLAPPACVPDVNARHLAQLYVLKDSQGKGFGRALLGSEGALWLKVWDQNAKAIRFYERMGFGAVGEDAWKFHDYVDRDLVMYAGSPVAPREGSEHQKFTPRIPSSV